MNQNYQNQNANQQIYLPNCLRCNIPLEPVMQLPLRAGGIQGFFSGWGQMDERILVLDTYRCPKCRKLEFFDLDASLPNK